MTFWLALTSAACSATISPEEFERQVREQLSFGSHPDMTSPGPSLAPLGERLLRMVQRVGATRAELNDVLLRMVEEGVKSPNTDRGASARAVAGGAASGLEQIGDATVVDRLAALAVAAPPHSVAVERAALRATTREAVEKLPNLAQRLVQRADKDWVYSILNGILESHLPTEPDARAKCVATIVGVFRGGLHDADPEVDRARIDMVKEKYDANYRTSDERRKLLNELGASKNDVDREYGLKLLQEISATPGATANATTLEGNSTSSVKLGGKNAPATVASPASDDLPSSPWNSPRVIILGLLTVVLLTFVVRRAVRK
ncbi:MAG: hypothetical protein NTV51_12275 [Verrucomicrobia bacterium]|nr:hypothetical protein [Verrucomicrobiota bacterium]